MPSRTKVVCTIGPASDSSEVLARLVDAGMSVARLNFSHGSRESHGETLERIRDLADRAGRPVAVLQDLAGLKIRVGEFEAGEVVLETGARFTLTTRDVPGTSERVSVSYQGLPADLEVGDTLLLSDGALELEVEETDPESIVSRVVVGGRLSSRKGINLPTSSVRAPGITDKDLDDLEFGLRRGVDLVALSFVRRASEVRDARRFIEQRGAAVPLLAKIETHEAVERIDEIIDVVDGIMVARGDLGVETPLSGVPRIQKMIIEKANRAGIPAITATHMLRSMVDSPRPTRAEVTDVANSILDGTDAVMLSEETAVGSYPVEAVEMMAKVAADTEAGFAHRRWMERFEDEERSPAQAMARAACAVAEDIDAAAILTCTTSGNTARMVARYRPRQAVLAATPREEVRRRLALVWGVAPLSIEESRDTDVLVEDALARARERQLLGSGDSVVVTAGVPVGTGAATNLIRTMRTS